MQNIVELIKRKVICTIDYKTGNIDVHSINDKGNEGAKITDDIAEFIKDAISLLTEEYGYSRLNLTNVGNRISILCPDSENTLVQYDLINEKAYYATNEHGCEEINNISKSGLLEVTLLPKSEQSKPLTRSDLKSWSNDIINSESTEPILRYLFYSLGNVNKHAAQVNIEFLARKIVCAIDRRVFNYYYLEQSTLHAMGVILSSLSGNKDVEVLTSLLVNTKQEDWANILKLID